MHTNEMQLGFMPGRVIFNTIFTDASTSKRKYLSKNRNLYLTFVDLEKALIMFLVKFYGRP